jgi:class 3 adenylate cyclase
MIKLSVEPPASFVRDESSGRWLLDEGGAGARSILVKEFPFVIGRAFDCGLRLPNSETLRRNTSRWHCYLTEASGGAAVCDGSLFPVPGQKKPKASISGTWLDGKRVKGSAAIEGEAVLGVGPWKFGVDVTAESVVEIDSILRDIQEQPGRAPDAGSAAERAFGRLHELFSRLERAADPESRFACALEFALGRIASAVVVAVLEEQPGGDLRVRAACHRERGRLDELRFNEGLLRGLPGDRSLVLGERKDGGGAAEDVSAGIVVPLSGYDGRMGFLYADNRSRGGGFSKEDVHLAHAIGAVVSLQLSLERQASLARLKKSMKRYFGADVVGALIEEARQGRLTKIAARKYEATVLFVDIQGFSALCRDREPGEIGAMLAPYYKLVSETGRKNGGFVDKFLGDGVLGVFGVTPTEEPGEASAHARAAARAAAEIMSAWKEGSLSPSKIQAPLRAGLHTDLIVAGDIGFEKRMEFGVIGDAVNFAARIEKFARPNAIAASARARDCIGEEMEFEDGGLQDVRGFGENRIWHSA